jgi:CAAX amino terminal protease family protein
MEDKKNSTLKVILGSILAISCLAVSQGIALGVGTSITKIGIPVWIANIISALMYISVCLLGMKMLTKRLLRGSLSIYRITPVRLHFKYFILAFTMTGFVVACLILSGGIFTAGNEEHKLAIITSSLLFYGLATGIVEESIFRGVILSIFEKRWNRSIAIVLPSILFGILHIVGSDLDLISIVQLILAGTLVGILFSLIAIESNSIWNSAIIHGIWNMVFVGNIIHFGTKSESDSIYNFVLSSGNRWITGGDFGVEASVFAIIAYTIFALLVFIWIIRKQH